MLDVMPGLGWWELGGNWLPWCDEVYAGLSGNSEFEYASCFEDGSARWDLMTAVSKFSGRYKDSSAGCCRLGEVLPQLESGPLAWDQLSLCVDDGIIDLANRLAVLSSDTDAVHWLSDHSSLFSASAANTQSSLSLSTSLLPLSKSHDSFSERVQGNTIQ